MRVCQGCGLEVADDDPFAAWRTTSCTALIRRGREAGFAVCGGTFLEMEPARG